MFNFIFVDSTISAGEILVLALPETPLQIFELAFYLSIDIYDNIDILA